MKLIEQVYFIISGICEVEVRDLIEKYALHEMASPLRTYSMPGAA